MTRAAVSQSECTFYCVLIVVDKRIMSGIEAPYKRLGMEIHHAYGVVSLSEALTQAGFSLSGHTISERHHLSLAINTMKQLTVERQTGQVTVHYQNNLPLLGNVQTKQSEEQYLGVNQPEGTRDQSVTEAQRASFTREAGQVSSSVKYQRLIV